MIAAVTIAATAALIWAGAYWLPVLLESRHPAARCARASLLGALVGHVISAVTA